MFVHKIVSYYNENTGEICGLERQKKRAAFSAGFWVQMRHFCAGDMTVGLEINSLLQRTKNSHNFPASRIVILCFMFVCI